MFVANCDNLDASVSTRLLGHLTSASMLTEARTRRLLLDHVHCKPSRENGYVTATLCEVFVRGEEDKTGGHLARTSDGKFTLREGVQVHQQDEKAFENMSRHPYFNTNNIRLNLEKLRAALKDGLFELPLIANEKEVDPTGKDDTASPIPQFSEPKPGAGSTVVQVETAMGAAISLFPDAQAIVVPSDCFLPVKTNAQLAVLRSDAFVVANDFTDIPLFSNGANAVLEMPKNSSAIIQVSSSTRNPMQNGKLSYFDGPIYWNTGILPRTWGTQDSVILH